ncbi:MAG: hypothetical protein FJX72_07255 [Armatimonadetes bacterium]|nr:hypothetical protein [Armatimonadota bacterium]
MEVRSSLIARLGRGAMLAVVLVLAAPVLAQQGEWKPACTPDPMGAGSRATAGRSFDSATGPRTGRNRSWQKSNV